MSHDIVADVLNQIMNAKKAKKTEVTTKKYSKVLMNVLQIAKDEGYINNFVKKDHGLLIEFSEKLNECKAIKPRYFVKKDEIEKFVRRYLPARDFGFIIVSSSKGMITHKEAMEKSIGGCLIAYFY